MRVHQRPDGSLQAELKARIVEFNQAHWQGIERRPLAVEVCDGQGQLVAGASACTFGRWLMLDYLWVAQGLRGQGWGSKVLGQLEQAALSRGCCYALLDTLDFQARPFYQRRGYEVKWQMEQYPHSGEKFFMVKALEKGACSIS